MQTLCPFSLSVFIFSKMQGEYPQYKVPLVEFSRGGLKLITNLTLSPMLFMNTDSQLKLLLKL